LAHGAETEDVQPVTLRPEALRLREVVESRRHRPLETWCGSHVDHLPAAHAEQMVMVLGEVLGELLPGASSRRSSEG
jgi:hypothetical protein